MKKLLILPVVLGVAACGTEDVKTMTVMGTECEVVKAFETSTIVKCPVVAELAAIQAETPNAMFTTVEGVASEYFANAEHIMVDVVPNECGEGTTGYRVMVKEPVFDGVAMHAVDKCM
ncbi:MAG: hypothetical protein ACLRFK_00615 [Alphaproteobacteria bacterium]